MDDQRTNLIVNYLPQNMTQEEIRSLFASIGPVESCKLIRDKVTGQSLAYAFVNYVNPGDASAAIERVNGMEKEGKTVKVSYARPSSSAIKNANLYVSGLPPEFTQEQLDQLFCRFGYIITSKVVRDPSNGLGKGIAFVRFDQNEQAQHAIRELNGTIPPGCNQQITVKYANPPRTQQQQQQQISTISAVTSVMPHGASAIATIQPQQRQPRGLSHGAGPMRHQQPSFRYSPLGLGQDMSAHGVGGATYGLAAAAVAQQAIQQGWCVFVYNIGQDCQDELLYQLFAPFGAITQVRVIRDFNTGKSKGYGFVNMVNYEDAYNAIMALNGYELEGKRLQVSFKSAGKGRM